MSKKGKNNKGQEIRSRHQRDLEALHDARLHQAQALRKDTFSVEEPIMLSDPLGQLQRDVVEDRPTASEIKERLIYSPNFTIGDVISAIREGNRRRGKEQHI